MKKLLCLLALIICARSYTMEDKNISCWAHMKAEVRALASIIRDLHSPPVVIRVPAGDLSTLKLEFLQDPASFESDSDLHAICEGLAKDIQDPVKPKIMFLYSSRIEKILEESKKSQ